jgi:serine phosphatase RsbU (regulator of sigma subunit)/CHASE3 domain sensor protein
VRGWLGVKIGPRIFLGFSCAALLTLAVALVSISYLRSVGQDLTTLADQDRLLQTNALELRIAVADESDGIRGYLLSGDATLLEPFTTGRSKFSSTANELRGLVQSDVDIELLSEAEFLHSKFLDVAEELVTLHDQDFPKAAVFLWQRQGNEARASLDRALADFVARQEETILANTRNARSEQNQALAISLGLVGVSMVAGVAGGIWITRSITKPLAHLAGTATEIAAGDLNRDARVERNDEIGMLARAFNSMTTQLRSLIGSLEQGVTDRTRELRTLEELGRAIINAPPDASALPELLNEYVPAMFPDCQTEIRILPDRTLFCNREDGPSRADSVWAWMAARSEAQYISQGEALPWLEGAASSAVVMAPILDVETKDTIGGIHLSCPHDPDTPSLLPAIQSLAAQIASALEGARRYAQELAHENVARELALAGQIQASFLPDRLPDVPGWQLAAMLKPARETSGDFYDVIELPSGRLGILIADVADKGMGAALFMALSRTLIRTYAIEYDTQPEVALSAANHRILEDTGAGLFVTVFYGVLDPMSGELTYSNAGHNPPYLVSTQEGGVIQELDRTGLPLGILDGSTWQQNVSLIAPGDLLLLYTDGITEAQNDQETFFDEDRLREVVRANWGRSATDIQDGVIAEVDGFVGDAPQFDDITMMVVIRDPSSVD